MKKINSNQLKNIAIICMIIDHLGYFLVNNISFEIYLLCRSIGRIAMPIFLFFLVQGFFYTRDLKKYITRLAIMAIITQLILNFLNYINIAFYEEKVKKIDCLNILFSFILILLLLRMINKKILKAENKKMIIYDFVLRLICSFSIISVYFLINIDYGIYLPVIALHMYFIEKNKDYIDKYVKYFLDLMVLTLCSILAIKNLIGSFSIVAYIFIALYNGKKVSNAKIISVSYYLVYPIQYLIIYYLALIINGYSSVTIVCET